MLGCSVASHSHGFLQQDTRVHVNVRDDLRPVESSPRHGDRAHTVEGFINACSPNSCLK